MRLILTFLILLSMAPGFYNCRYSETVELLPEPAYPKWLKSENYRTYQTSGITFLGSKQDVDNVNKEMFLLADDDGLIHRFEIENDTLFNFTSIKFSQEVSDYLNDFPEIDFEEIVFDSSTNEVYLTIEGNGKDYLKYHGVFKVHFKNEDVFEDSIIGIEKLNITPNEKFTQYLKRNVGYEGLAVDRNFIYLGLEGTLVTQNVFTDSTFISIIDKKSLKIVKEISTKNISIATICGLYSDADYSLWGIDRNNRKIFELTFNKELEVEETLLFPITTVIPNYHQYEYVGSIESITMDDQKKLFIIDDPWTEFFIPGENVLSKLDNETAKNFTKFIPVIFKYSIIHK